jgi:flavin reductase (DIM6/NTAB) family NADH-FMN oxidoreductase RutF
VPTGVAVFAGLTADASPGGLAVGSFSSASLDPPLLVFFVASSSTSWPTVRANGIFGVNVLSGDQGPLCRAFARSVATSFST